MRRVARRVRSPSREQRIGVATDSDMVIFGLLPPLRSITEETFSLSLTVDVYALYVYNTAMLKPYRYRIIIYDSSIHIC